MVPVIKGDGYVLNLPVGIMGYWSCLMVPVGINRGSVAVSQRLGKSNPGFQFPMDSKEQP